MLRISTIAAASERLTWRLLVANGLGEVFIADALQASGNRRRLQALETAAFAEEKRWSLLPDPPSTSLQRDLCATGQSRAGGARSPKNARKAGPWRPFRAL
jgi:hypothetical protein